MKNKISPRETEVLHLISYGLTSIEIGNRLYISEHTANTHRKNIMQKLTAKNSADLVRIGFELGIISFSSDKSSAQNYITPAHTTEPTLRRVG